MDILSYVQELLQQQTAVGVTGLGTFYKKKSAGRYDKEKKSFVPPSYILQFNAELKEDNGLASFAASKKEISVDSVNYYIDKFVEEVNKKLELAHEAELNGLGRLYFTEHEGLSFDPEKDINLGSEFFGLPEIPQTDTPAATKPITEQETEPVHEEIAEAPKAKDFENKPEPTVTEPVIENIDLDEVKDDLKQTLKHTAVNSAVEETAKTYVSLEGEKIVKPAEAPAFIQEQHQEHPNRFGHNPAIDYSPAETEQNSPWLKIIISVLVLAAIAAGIYFAKPEWFSQKHSDSIPMDSIKVDTAKITIDSAKIKQDSVAKTDSILKAHAVKPAVKDTVVAKKASTSTAVAAVTAPAAKEGAVTYDVIAASFKTEAKAEIFVNQMKAYGLNAKIVSLPGRLKKVSIASFKTEKEAYEKRPELAEKIKIKDLDIIQINTTP